MTLKEKFHQWLKTDPFFNENPTLREYQCEQIADNYAIEFAEWLFLWKQNSIGEWKHQNKNKIINSTKELLEIFKKEKGYV